MAYAIRLWYIAAMESDTDNNARMYTVTQAAGLLGIERNTVLRQITKGVLHAKRLGSIYVIAAAEVERYRHTHRGKVGFASPDHPLHAARGRSR